MSNPIVIAHHLIWTAYGWWLPNDPRGSSSHQIACDVIAALGRLHHGRKRLQPESLVIRDFYEQAEPVLKHDLLIFNSDERCQIAESFDDLISERQYTCYACAIMPDHVHILIRKHRDQAEEMIEHLQNRSRGFLRGAGMREMNHPIWGGPGWKVFLDHPDEIRRTIRYIQDNPEGMRLPPQRWDFVKPYDGWPLHPGHSPNSAYAKRLRAAGRYP